MKILEEKIERGDLWQSENVLDELMIKGVVDVEKGILGIDAEMHADIEQVLLNNGSKQEDLWGINLYPDGFDEDGIVEFDSMINVRPRQNNRSRDVEDPEIRRKIRGIVEKWVK